MKKYDIILADPPWSFDVWNPETGGDRSPEAHYSTMTVEDICALPVADIAAKNCALFLWAVWPRIFDAEKVINSWGFTYRTLAWVWVKANRNGLGFFTGMGYYTRANTEPCLLAVRGSMPVNDHGIQALIYSAVLQHSRKPIDQYRKIRSLYPEGRRVELFARRSHPGWDAWGNEAPASVPLFDS